MTDPVPWPDAARRARRRLLDAAAVAPAILAVLLVGAWGFSGFVIVPPDARAVAERFGAPDGVLLPGLHVRLPWPLDGARQVDFGRVHEIAMGDGAAASMLPVAGSGGGLQVVTADLRVLYRVGLRDADAVRAAATADPDALARAAAGQAVTSWFAAHTRQATWDANSAVIGESLRRDMQATLDGAQSGLDILAVAVAIAAPDRAGGNTPAAEITAARGAAAAMAAQAQQHAGDRVSDAQGAAAATVGAARIAAIRFAADRDAARVGGQAFLLERYFSALEAALRHAPTTIIDHRLNWPEPPVLDLRPLAASAMPAGEDKP